MTAPALPAWALRCYSTKLLGEDVAHCPGADAATVRQCAADRQDLMAALEAAQRVILQTPDAPYREEVLAKARAALARAGGGR